jgi:hypothetical protein
MSWSLKISAGDIDLLSSSSGMAIVTGKEKTFQDLKLWLSEAMGSDPMHPEYGSLLDGGRLPNGTIIESFIGSDSLSTSRVEQEVVRIIEAFIRQQNERISLDMSNLGKTTVSDSEIIDSIGSIRTSVFDNKLVLRISLIMRNGNDVTITQPLG